MKNYLSVVRAELTGTEITLLAIGVSFGLAMILVLSFIAMRWLLRKWVK
jgi:hypothetical protein